MWSHWLFRHEICSESNFDKMIFLTIYKRIPIDMTVFVCTIDKINWRLTTHYRKLKIHHNRLYVTLLWRNEKLYTLEYHTGINFIPTFKIFTDIIINVFIFFSFLYRIRSAKGYRGYEKNNKCVIPFNEKVNRLLFRSRMLSRGYFLLDVNEIKLTLMSPSLEAVRIMRNNNIMKTSFLYRIYEWCCWRFW